VSRVQLKRVGNVWQPINGNRKLVEDIVWTL